MKKLVWLALALPAVAFALMQSSRPAAPAANATATADLVDAQGQSVGRVQLEETANGVVLTGEITKLPPGDHAIHFHQVGKCEAPFKSAGDHFNPTNKQHGVKAAKGKHAGDLPNLTIPEGGKLKFQLFTHDVTLKKGRTSLFDKDGTAIVIHANADDHISAPAGNAGDRIACGVVSWTDGAAAGSKGGATGGASTMPTDPGMSAGRDAGTALPGNMGGGHKDGGTH